MTRTSAEFVAEFSNISVTITVCNTDRHKPVTLHAREVWHGDKCVTAQPCTLDELKELQTAVNRAVAFLDVP